MNKFRAPGFTAEYSTSSVSSDFQAAFVAASTATRNGVRPQMSICTDINEDSWSPEVACRAHCYVTKRGAALRACLNEC
jgi:hypothetical protein